MSLKLAVSITPIEAAIFAYSPLQLHHLRVRKCTERVRRIDDCCERARNDGHDTPIGLHPVDEDAA